MKKLIHHQNNSTNRARTCDILINSQTLYQLSYGGLKLGGIYFLPTFSNKRYLLCHSSMRREGWYFRFHTIYLNCIIYKDKLFVKFFLFDFSQRSSALPYRLFLTINELSEPLGWWITMITRPPWRYGTRYCSIIYFLTVPKSVGSHLTSDAPFENVDFVPYLDSRLLSHKVGLGCTHVVRNQ